MESGFVGMSAVAVALLHEANPPVRGACGDFGAAAVAAAS